MSTIHPQSSMSSQKMSYMHVENPLGLTMVARTSAQIERQ